MGKGERHREQRRAEQARVEAEERARAEARAERDAFFESWDPEDDAWGPALPCPECNAFERRWASGEERVEALAAFDAEWDLPHDPEHDDRKVTVCLGCGARTVISSD